MDESLYVSVYSNNYCTHSRNRGCLLTVNWISWWIFTKGGTIPGGDYFSQNNYANYLVLQGLNLNTLPDPSLYILSPPLLSCQGYVYVVANATVENS